MLSKLIGNTKPGHLFIVSGPGGVGKTTLVEKLCQEFDVIVENVSFTTRAPRINEKKGIDYHFIDAKTFEDKLQKGDFLEHAKVYDAFYGTDKKQVEALLNEGKHVILVIDIEGAKQVKKAMHSTSIFISPPSLEALEERLKHRKSKTHEKIEWKVQLARKEMEEIPLYDYLIVNDDLDIAYEKLKAIIIAKECTIENK